MVLGSGFQIIASVNFDRRFICFASRVVTAPSYLRSPLNKELGIETRIKGGPMEGQDVKSAVAVIDNGKFGKREIKFETGRLAK